jgi:hypothetical protein
MRDTVCGFRANLARRFGGLNERDFQEWPEEKDDAVVIVAAETLSEAEKIMRDGGS